MESAGSQVQAAGVSPRGSKVPRWVLPVALLLATAGAIVAGRAFGDLPSADRGVVFGFAGLVAALTLGTWGVIGVRRAERDTAAARQEARISHLMDHSYDAILFCGPDGRIRTANRRATELYGMPMERLTAMSAGDLRAPAERKGVAEDLASVRSEGACIYETRHVRADGGEFPVEVSARFVPEGEGGYFLAAVRDVSGRKDAEGRIRLLNRVLRTTHLVNLMLGREQDPTLIARECCRLLCAVGEFRGAWIASGSPGGVLRLEAAEGDAGEIARECGVLPTSVGSASGDLRLRSPVVIGDFASGGEGSAWEREALRRGLRSCILVPVVAGDRSLGILGILSTSPGVFSEEVLDLVVRLGTDVGIAVDRIEAVRAGAQQARRAEASEAQYRLLFDSSRIPLWVHDLETLRFLAVNDAAVRKYGWTREEFLSMTVRDIQPAEDVPRLLEAVALVREGRVAPTQWRHRTRDGRTLSVEIVSYVVEFSGRTCEFVAANDVSELVQTQERLQILSRAVEQSPVSIVITDTGGTIQFVNPQFCRTTGFSREEVLGRNPRILKSGLHPREFYEGLWKTILSGSEWRGEIQNRRKDGTVIWESVVIAPVSDGTGHVTNFVAVKEDITKRRTLEEQFRQAQKMEAVGRLAGGVAHDFNNLLTVISGYTEMVLHGMEEKDPRHAHLKEVHKASVRASDLTRQLLAFSRKQVLQPRPVDLNASVAGMEKMLRRLLGEDIEVVLRLDPALHPVIVDPGQVEQAIMNLSVNARDAMPSGGRLVITTANRDVAPGSEEEDEGSAPGAWSCLEVVDTGSGMTEEVRSHIFEPFFTTKPMGKGTGLGLPMVFGFVAQSGGKIEVDSEPGRGSTFRMLLPRARSPEGAAGGGRAAGPAVRGTETILVVEDDASVAAVARCSLEGSGFRVLSANGAEAAVRICGDRSGPVDLLLTDVVMPGRNGRQVADACRGLRPGLPVLFMSGYTDDVIGAAGVLEPGIELLPKPFQPADLCARVRSMLDAARGGRAGPTIPT